MRRWIDRMRLRVRSLVRPAAVDAALRRELQLHIAEQTDEYVTAGMTPADARARAKRELGSLAVIEEGCRDTRRVRLFFDLLQDVRYARRSLARQPMLVLAGTLSIAVAAGMNITILGLASELLLAAPSVRQPEQVARIRIGGSSHVSYRQWQALGQEIPLDGLAGYRIESEVNWRGPEASVSLVPMIVSPNFFDVLGLPMMAGRGFTAAEADVNLQPRLAVVSHGFWQHRLGGDPQVVGRTLTFNGRPYTITGVLPRTLRAMIGYGLAPEVYLSLSRELRPGLEWDPLESTCRHASLSIL